MLNRYTLCSAVLAILTLPACSVDSDSWMNSSRIEVKNDVFTDTFDTASINDSMLHAIGTYYYRYGNGDMNVVVSYDPRSSVNTQGKAQAALNRIVSGLKREGVTNIQSSLSASPGIGDSSLALVTFPAITAAAPEDCTMMPGYDNPSDSIQSEPNGKPNYKMGCTVETLLSRQLARPSDMLGKDGFETKSDGRRQERVLSTRGYYGDKPNAPLKGEDASDKK